MRNIINKINIVVHKILQPNIALIYPKLAIGIQHRTIQPNKVIQNRYMTLLRHNYQQNLNNKFVYNYTTTIQQSKSRPVKLKIPVHEFLDAHQLEYIDAPNVYKIKYCPFCPKPHNQDRTNLYVISVQKMYGYFHCFRCSAKGNWFQFRQKVLGIDSEITPQSILSQNAFTKNTNSQSSLAKISEVQYFFYKQNLWSPQYSDSLEYVRARGFKDETIRAFNLGAGIEEFYDQEGKSHKVKLIYFPLYKKKERISIKQDIINQLSNHKNHNFVSQNSWTQLVKIKMRGASSQTKKHMRQYPIGGAKGLFGLHLVKDTDNVIVVTEGEFDAMAVYQQTGYPAVSLPHGVNNLPQVLLPYFDRFDKIYLWMDNDEAGILNTGKIAEKLGLNKTCIVRHTVVKMKDANDFLLKSPTMISELLHKAKTIPDSNIINFSRLRETIKQKMTNEQVYRGVKVNWLPYFNQKVKGIRPGELTVVSGPTGSGKTTFLSQVFLDICQRDIGVLWGSFQIRNEILITHMLNQFANINLAKNIEKFQYYADNFQKLPLYMMNFYGSTNIEKIISTIVYSIQKYNIHMVVIDTLQFLLSQQAEGFKKFQLQDSLMAKLRQISIKYNVHVAIVIHPRKTEESQDIGIHSIYGTSKSTQEADNIWIIQNREGFKILDIKKNRYDGQLGRIPLGFNRDNKRFFQLKKDEFSSIRLKQKTMVDIIRQRETKQLGSKTPSQAQQLLFDDQIEDHDLRKKQKPNGVYPHKNNNN